LRLTALVVSLFMLFALSFGCGGGSDPEYSPDPSVGDVVGGDETPGGDETEPTSEDGEKTGGASNDCFEDGFCDIRCVNASECPPGFSCVMHMCTFDCLSDDECGTGGVCNDSGLCEATDAEPMPDCVSDSECGSGRFCNPAGTCEKISVLLGCRNDADCPLGQYCDDSHTCEIFPDAGVACSVDDDCPGNYHCGASSLCIQECRTHSQCGAGEACDDGGRCILAGIPAGIAYFSFNSTGAASDPIEPATYASQSYRIDMVEIAPAGRPEMLASTSFRLVGSASTAAAGDGGASYIPFQGHLIDAVGLDVNRSVKVEVRLYDSLISGIGQGVENSHVIYADEHPVVDVEGGLFRIGIGGGSPLDPDEPVLPIDKLLEAENVFMELWIDGERLSPRQGLGTIPAVFHAKYARYADEVENLPPVTEGNLPNYPAELIKAGTLSAACIPSGLSVSKITGSLGVGNIPNLSASDFDDLGSLPSGVIGQMDAGKITSGTISKELLPDGSYIARDNLMVLSGSISNEQMLVFPSGFDPTTEGVQCGYMLTPGITMGSVEGIDRIYLEKSDSNVIRCEVDQHEESDETTHTVPCTANYMIICKK